MPETLKLSEAALALFRLHVELQGEIEVDDTNRESYSELEATGLVLLSRPFVGEPVYRLTKMGWKLADVLDRISEPSPAGSAVPLP